MLIFISHATRDQSVIHVREQLEALGHEVYLAEYDPQPGRQLAEKIDEKIRACDLMVVLLTQDGYNSRYVTHEIGIAQGVGKLVIPLVDPKLAKEDLAHLNGTEYIPFDPNAPVTALRDLTIRIQELANKQQVTQERTTADKRVADQQALIGVAVMIAAVILLSRGNN